MTARNLGADLAAAGVCVALAASASAAQSRTFDVPAQSAISAIPELARQADIQILVSESAARNKRTHAVSGVMPVTEAVHLMLRGTGLRIKSNDGRTFTLATGAPGESGPNRTSGYAQASIEQRMSAAEAAPPPSALPVAEAAAPAAQDTIIVTGSRIGTPGFVAPTPVTEISPIQYEMKNVTTVTDLLNDIPALTPNQSQSVPVGVGSSFFNLRNLGPTRTLTLINGQRTQPTSIDGLYDINTIPAGLVSHIDIVTGGASAGYGSDAVSGIVNVTLNDRLVGFRAKASEGLTYYGDDETRTASIAYGTVFGGGRGHFVVGADYFHAAGIAYQNARPFGSKSWGLIADPACTTYTTTCTNLLITQNVVNATTTDGGVITAGPLKNIMFGPGGVLQTFTPGQLRGATLMIGGSGSDFNKYTSSQPRIDRQNALLAADYDVSDNVNLWAHMLFARSVGFFHLGANYDAGNITITNQNPFIPAALRTLMTQNGVTSFLMGRTNIDFAPKYFGNSLFKGTNTDYDPSAGIKGKFDALGSDWSWDLRGQYSYHRMHTLGTQNRSTIRFTEAVDAVPNPAVGGVPGIPVGQAVCRSTLTNPTNGCAPINLFGPNTADSAALRYFMGTSVSDARMKMSDASAGLKGTPFSTWAGVVSVAMGAEYRRQSMVTTADPTSAALDWRQNNASPFAGHYSVVEGYFETDIPIAKDAPLIKAMDVNAAVRETHYSTSGSVTTWKVGLNWSLNDDIRLRATRSHDIRAPNLQELYQTGVLRAGFTVVNPVTNQTVNVNMLTSGNPNLTPEIGNTVTGGVVLSPSWLPGFNVSVDYWNIKIRNQILQVPAQTVVNNCLRFNLQSFCPAIFYSPVTGLIQTVATTPFNVAALKTDGIDFEIGYRFQARDLIPGMAGRVQLQALGSYLRNYITDQFGLVLNTAGGVVAGLPRFRSNVNLIWISDKWRVGLNGTFEGGGKVSALYNTTKYTYAQGARTINDNSVKGRFYLNTNVNYAITPGVELFVNAKNLFNVQPPILPDMLNYQHAVGAGALYDHVGGMVTVGVKLAFD